MVINPRGAKNTKGFNGILIIYLRNTPLVKKITIETVVANARLSMLRTSVKLV